MRTALYTIILMTGFSSFACAADPTDVQSGTYAVQKMICNKVYVPATGAQSPTYQAGIDVKGDPVVPADINAVQDNTPDYVEVPMTIDLAKRMGVSPIGMEANMPVANLKLYKNGKVEYNGQDVSSQASDMCGVTQKSDAKMVEGIAPAAGQEQMLVVPSVTSHPDPSLRYQPDTVAPDDMTPKAASVAASSTVPEPKIEIKLPKGVANMSSRPVGMPQ